MSQSSGQRGFDWLGWLVELLRVLGCSEETIRRVLRDIGCSEAMMNFALGVRQVREDRTDPFGPWLFEVSHGKEVNTWVHSTDRKDGEIRDFHAFVQRCAVDFLGNSDPIFSDDGKELGRVELFKGLKIVYRISADRKRIKILKVFLQGR